MEQTVLVNFLGIPKTDLLVHNSNSETTLQKQSKHFKGFIQFDMP